VLGLVWAALLMLLGRPRADPDRTAFALYGLATLLVFAATVLVVHYRRSAGVPRLLIAGGVLFVLSDLADTLAAVYALPPLLAVARTAGLLSLPAALVTIVGVTQWVRAGRRALRRQVRLSRRLATLNDALSTLTAGLEPLAVARAVLTHAVETLRAEAGTVLLIDPRSGELEFVAGVGPQAEQLTGLHLPPGTGLAGWVARQGRGVRVSNAQVDSRFYAGIDRLTGQTTRALLAVPLRTPERTFGVIELVHPARGAGGRAAGEFSEDDLAFMELLARSAAAVLENARVHAQNRARLRELETLHEASVALASSLERDQVLAALARHIARAARAGGTLIYRWSEAAGRLELAAQHGAGEPDGLLWSPAPPQREPLDAYPLAQAVLRSGQPAGLRVDDEQADPAERARLRAHGAQAALLVPLVVAERTIGLIEVIEAREPRAFRAEEVQVVQVLASLAALALS
jgi:GAF domain-containing protein